MGTLTPVSLGPSQRQQSVADLARVVIEGVSPSVDEGRFASKAVVGDDVRVEADVFADGHDTIRAVLQWRYGDDDTWREVPFSPLGNDRWAAAFGVDRVGVVLFDVEAWIDPFATWRHDIGKKLEAGQPVGTELQVLVAHLRSLEAGPEQDEVNGWIRRLEAAGPTPEAGFLDEVDRILAPLEARHAERPHATRLPRPRRVQVDPTRARASSWYEVFPRSTHPERGKHGTFGTLAKRLSYIQSMGFDTVYLPPIHPIGTTNRKGKDNTPRAQPGDVGSPWAIGAREGGHTATHPELGTLDDFDRFLEAARALDLDVALDLAFQCSPDHPWVRQHPSWFKHRPDGSIQYAENPPKKYEDIVPFDFSSPDADGLWRGLKDVVDFWIRRGVRTFRVDNPHTKPFAFWEWLIGETRRDHPEVLFLAEAFTRPKVMHRLAKLGFTHSYTYFTWRNTRRELEDYLTELHASPVRDFFRPHFWANTPDILPGAIQDGGRVMSMTRFLLSATLVGNYGVYGPAFELLDTRPLAPGKEEYLHSEKYQLRHWNLEDPNSLRAFITLVNRIRAENPALLRDDGLRFHDTDNAQLVCYSRRTPDRTNVLLVIVNLDPHYPQAGWTRLDLEELGAPPSGPFAVRDLLADATYTWNGPRNYVELRPTNQIAHILLLTPSPANVDPPVADE